MQRVHLPSGIHLVLFLALTGVARLHAANAKGEQPSKPRAELLSLEQRAQINYDAYILGPGDALKIELLDLPELSGVFSIGPDGTLYLPSENPVCRGSHS